MKCVIVCYIIFQIISTYIISLTVQQSVIEIQLVLLIGSSFFYIMVSSQNPGYYYPSFQNKCNQFENTKKFTQTEVKVCKKCNIKQLLRMKHCYECGHCVATFDHHCIWVSNCIGQKNRPTFICCLFSNIIQITYAMYHFIASMWQKGEKYTYQISFLSFLGIALSGITVLFCLHCYLMIVNLTTWEFISWDKIYYLSHRLRSKKSPFSRGSIRNIKDYWSLGCERDLKIWNPQGRQIQESIKQECTQNQTDLTFSESKQFR